MQNEIENNVTSQIANLIETRSDALHDAAQAISDEATAQSIEAQSEAAFTVANAVKKIAKRNAKKRNVAKPVKASPEAIATERAEITAETREMLRKFYNGASEAIHSTKPCARSLYALRAIMPVQRIGSNGPTSRDDSALAMLFSDANGKTYAFNPEKAGATGADLGCVSRLASALFIAYEAETDTFTVTKLGASRARSLLKRVA